MAERQWSAEQIREAMGRLSSLDVDGELARARELGTPDASKLRDLLRDTKEFARSVAELPVEAIPDAQKDRIVSSAHTLQERWAPYQKKRNPDSRGLLTGLLTDVLWFAPDILSTREDGSSMGEAAQAVGESVGEAAQAVGEGLGEAAQVVGEGLGDALGAVGDLLSGFG